MAIRLVVIVEFKYRKINLKQSPYVYHSPSLSLIHTQTMMTVTGGAETSDVRQGE